MTLEEKLHIKLDWMNVKHIAVDVIIQDIVVICQQEIVNAKIKELEHWREIFADDEEELYEMLVNSRIEQLKGQENA